MSERPQQRWFCDPGSPLSDWATGLAWFWRLGERSESLEEADVAFAAVADAGEVMKLAEASRLKAAIVVVSEPGKASGPIPEVHAISGVAKFGSTRVEGDFLRFSSGKPFTESSLGNHAVTDGATLMLAADAVGIWGRVDGFWIPEAILSFLREQAVATEVLPAVGCLRLDDFPGTALAQVQDRDHPDRRQSKRARAWGRWFRRKGAVLNVAVACQALEHGERVELERIWPGAIEAIGDAAKAGIFEAVCHGALHLDTEAYDRGEIEFREFAHLEADEATKRIDLAIAWQRRNLDAPRTFVAPAWAYGPASDAIAADRGLIRWHPPRPGVPLVEGRMHETVVDGQFGIWRLDYSPLVRMARSGIPPMIITHGANLDQRLPRLRSIGSLPSLVRLVFRRDLLRLAAVDGITWVGAGDLGEMLTVHGEKRS